MTFNAKSNLNSIGSVHEYEVHSPFSAEAAEQYQKIPNLSRYRTRRNYFTNIQARDGGKTSIMITPSYSKS